MSDPAAELRPDLLDDFYAECDDLLSNARRCLERLEQALDAGRTDPGAVEALFRSLHSIKGNAAIVGLNVAETLAHAAEEVLRPLARHEAGLERSRVDLLGVATHRLEQVISCHRLQQSPPEVEDLVRQLETVIKAPPPAAAPAAGRESWQATFTPSPEHEGRGVNINAIRTRLGALGEITAAVPRVLPGGRITFTFTLALREPPADLAAWEADGVLMERLEAPPVGHELPEPVDNLHIAPSHIVRVDLSRLDELMRITGEMVIIRSQLEQRLARLNGDQAALQEINIALGRSLRELREAITRVRLVPVAEIFSRMPFVVRDLARASGRSVRLVLEGQHTEIDKYLVERLKEPLLHLVRNAISHGIEPAAERIAAGKPAEATIRLRAAAVGQTVLIQVADDGRGIDVPRVKERAAARGLSLPPEPTSHDVLRVLCQPGFSTRDEADHAAGRGVGMDVVETSVRELGGSLSFETRLGESTEFTLRLPLTLSIAETFTVSAAGQLCAVPQAFVEEIIQITESQVRTIRNVEIVPYRDGILPLVRLREMFQLPRANTAQIPVMVLTSERGSTGLVVDRVHGQREVVVRSIHDPLVQVPGISGATELGDGRPVLILDAVALTGGAVRPPRHSASPDPLPARPAA